MLKKLYLGIITVLLGVSSMSYSMIYDNRWFPLYPKPFVRDPYKPSFLALQPLFMYADQAFGNDREIGLPELNGNIDEINSDSGPGYNQSILAQALVRSGRVARNPLRSDLRGRPIPWSREGILTAQGVAFYYEQALTSHVSFGLTGLLLHYNFSQEFLFNDNCLGPENFGQRMYLYLLKNKIHKELGLQPLVFSDINFGDVDFYLRWGSYWEYACRCRLINIGLKFGALGPTAPVRDIRNPASLPIGGNGHWGIYTGFDGQFELREDIIVGFDSRIIKRLKKTQYHRMPILSEPSFYGAVVGLASVDPGVTYVFSPYAKLLGISDAFGLGAQYTIVAHQEDRWKDYRKDQSIPVNLDPVVERSKWRAQYVTVSAFWDLGKYVFKKNLLPKVILAWDIPVESKFAKQMPLTHSVSLILQVDY